MIYFSGISLRHLDRWEIPDDTPRFSSVHDCYQLFLGMHLKMMRNSHEEYDPFYERYLACVDHFSSRLRLDYREFRNAVGIIVDLYQQFFDEAVPRKKKQSLLDSIGKFERLIYMYSNKTPSSISSGG